MHKAVIKIKNMKEQLVNIKVKRNVANLLKVYCVLKQKKMSEIASTVLEKELDEFERKLKNLRFN